MRVRPQRCCGDCGQPPACGATVERGGPAPRQEPQHATATAQSLGWNLSRTLMTVIVLIKTNQGYFVIPANEFDGDPEQVVREYDPFAR